jgi:hypothetical protein
MVHYRMKGNLAKTGSLDSLSDRASIVAAGSVGNALDKTTI